MDRVTNSVKRQIQYCAKITKDEDGTVTYDQKAHGVKALKMPTVDLKE